MRTLYLMVKKEKFVNNVKESKMGNLLDAILGVKKLKGEYDEQMSSVWLQSTNKRTKHKSKDKRLNVKEKQKYNSIAE